MQAGIRWTLVFVVKGRALIMSAENPLLPQGSLWEQKQQSRSRVRTAFFCVLAVHVVAIGTVLIVQGCKREEAPPSYPELSPTLPVFDTNLAPVVTTDLPPPMVETSTLPVLPAPRLGPGAPAVTGPAPGVVPTPPPTAPLGPAPSTEYTVVAGDTMYGIARKVGVPLRSLLDANPGVDPRRLRVGQKLVVPAPTGSGAAAGSAGGGTVAAPATGTGGEQVYVVQSGDNLTKIARRFGTTVQALREANQLRTDRIRVGDKLRIPAGAPRSDAPVRVEPPAFVPPAVPSPPGPQPSPGGF